MVVVNCNDNFFQLYCIVTPTHAGSVDLWPVSVTQFLVQESNEICDITSQLFFFWPKFFGIQKQLAQLSVGLSMCTHVPK